MLKLVKKIDSNNYVCGIAQPKELDKNVSIDVREGEREHEVAITKVCWLLSNSM